MPTVAQANATQQPVQARSPFGSMPISSTNPMAASTLATVPFGATGTSVAAPGTLGYTGTVQPTNGANFRTGDNATQVQISPDILNSMQQYQNAAYQNQTAVLDPQTQQQTAQFNAQMAAQGLQPGSQAYNQAYQQLQQSQNNAYQSAYNNSFQTGLGAQNQAFTQGYDNSQLANALRIAQLQKSATLGAAGIGANASMSNNAANNATNQLLGMGNLGLGYGQLQNQTNTSDIANMMSLYGPQEYNNGQISGAQNTLFGMIPNQSPTPVDVTGAYGLNQQGQNLAYGAAQNSANSTNQMVGSAASLAMVAVML